MARILSLGLFLCALELSVGLRRPAVPHRGAFVGRSSRAGGLTVHPWRAGGVPQGVRLAAVSGASSISTNADPGTLLAELLNAARSGGEDGLAAALKKNLDFCDYNFIMYLQHEMEDAGDTPLREELIELMSRVNVALQSRLAEADEKLREVLSAGDLKAMEAKMRNLLRLGEVDVAFMVVLNMNQRQAAEAGAETASNVLTHLYTFIQQEQDSLVPAGTRLLRMLLRTECDGARETILREKLILEEELEAKIGVADEDRMWGMPEVLPQELETAIDNLVIEASSMGPEVKDLLTKQCDMLRGELEQVLGGVVKGLACEAEGDCDGDDADCDSK